MFYWNMLFEYWDRITGYNMLNNVLILVLLEYALWVRKAGYKVYRTYGLNPCFTGICSLRQKRVIYRFKWKWVLILVLLEYALWVLGILLFRIRVLRSLNPCFTGICSLSVGGCVAYVITKSVLILVLLEYALWGWLL